MRPRDHDRSSEQGRARSQSRLPRREVHPVLALQRLIGNRGTVRVLARKGKGKGGTFPNSVQIGKSGPIEITAGNLGDWLAKKDPETLTLTTTKGKHSDEPKRRAESKEPIEKVVVTSVNGENTFVVLTFEHARIKGYEADG